MIPQVMAAAPWDLWRSQMAAILRLELRKTFFAKRAWWIYLLALGPVLITGAHSLIMLQHDRSAHPLAEDIMIFAGIFQLFYLRLGIFFGCVGIFSGLFRGEVLEKTLHYYFLAPVRREVLAAGKYVAGLAAATAFFAGSAVLSLLLITLHFGAEQQVFLFRQGGWKHVVWYAVISALACAGYGAVFLLMGLWFRNPMLPAAVVMVWEGLNPFLPALLKKFSVIFYLKSLCPVSVPAQDALAIFMVEAAPAPAWIAIPGLLGVVALVLAYAGYRVKRLEVSYTE